MAPSITIFTVSDLHLGHENIIRYCRRPFASVEEMDSVLIQNWNEVVTENDEVIYVGDLSFGRIPLKEQKKMSALSKNQQQKERVRQYVKKLNGKITWIKGNHLDPDGTILSTRRRYQGHEFIFVHDPARAAEVGFHIQNKIWLVSGHHHNNDLVNYPFFRREKHWFNVSAELTDYRPVSLDTLVEIITSPEARLSSI